MFAIETKKRKFDRALEAINNLSTTSLASRTPGAGHETKTGTAAPSTENPRPESKKRLRLSDEVRKTEVTKKSSTTSLQPPPNYLPHSQSSYLSRLSTFSSIHDWRVSPTEDVNAVQWAKRGWTCVGRERVACRGGCGAEMLVKLEDESTTQTDSTRAADEEDDDDALALSEERHKLLVEKYKELIISGHLAHCPWRRRGCDASIQRLPLLNAQSSVRDLQTRYDGILESSTELPANIRLSEGGSPSEAAKLDVLNSDHDIFADGSDTPWTDRNRRAFMLAMAGWEPGVGTSDADVMECRACFRRLGLWLYRPKAPGAATTMEHLDAVDSHLDFCPWKSPEAQQTQMDIDGKNEELPGWLLLARNVKKEAARIARKQTDSTRPLSKAGSTVDVDDDDAVTMRSQYTTEEKEKRAKALMRKIRELKRPFNVKGLLKKKDPAK